MGNENFRFPSTPDHWDHLEPGPDGPNDPWSHLSACLTILLADSQRHLLRYAQSLSTEHTLHYITEFESDVRETRLGVKIYITKLL